MLRLCLLVVVVVIIFPTASALLVPQISTQLNSHRQTILRKYNSCHDDLRKLARSSSSCSSLAMMDPSAADFLLAQQQHHQLIDLHASSTVDWLSSFTLAKANIVVPNQSIAPLPETIKSIFDAAAGSSSDTDNLLEVIPDLPSMPGGVPRSGNAFLSGSFRDLYQAPIVPPDPKLMSMWNNNGIASDGSMAIPGRELDVLARYADLLSRIPLAAAVYALFDFFVINAEEDMAIAELLVGGDDDDEEENDEAMVQAIMAVENKVVMQRFIGLFAIVAVTVMWSLLSYHPVPFNEL
jgi:hypothetical protein